MSENTQTEKDIEKSADVAWNWTAKWPRFIIFDARSLFPLAIWALHISWFTFYIAISGIFFFGLLEYFRITPAVLFRSIRCAISGNNRYSFDPIIYRRRIKM